MYRWSKLLIIITVLGLLLTLAPGCAQQIEPTPTPTPQPAPTPSPEPIPAPKPERSPNLTPESPAPTEWINWGIMQPQIQANIALVGQGYDVIESDYELLEAEESETSLVVRATHNFKATCETSTIQLNGEGVYKRTETGLNEWIEETILSLNKNTNEGIFTINYKREYLSADGSYDIRTVRSTSSTIESLSGIMYFSSLVSSPTTTDSVHIKFSQKTVNPEGIVEIEGSKDERLISPDRLKGTANLTIDTNGTNTRLISTEYTKTIDSDYVNYILQPMNPLLEINSEYDKYNIVIANSEFSLEEQAYFRVEEDTDGTFFLDWKLAVGDESETIINTAGSGTVEEVLADGKSKITAELEEINSDISYMLSIDPIPFYTAYGGLIAAIAGAFGPGASIQGALKPKQCSACGGTGQLEVKCEFCGGSGQYVCPICGGSGKVTCPDCGGRGWQICPPSGEVVCPECHGDGSSCEVCGGQGWIKCEPGKRFVCSRCGGTGEVRCPAVFCPGVSICPSCGGKGYIEIPCDHCGGDGMR